jgi:hypothetical protein
MSGVIESCARFRQPSFAQKRVWHLKGFDTDYAAYMADGTVPFGYDDMGDWLRCRLAPASDLKTYVKMVDVLWEERGDELDAIIERIIINEGSVRAEADDILKGLFG